MNQTQLTELAEQNPDAIIKALADLIFCGAKQLGTDWWYFNDDFEPVCKRQDFNPLAKTERGRSQAFELAVKFGIWISDDADQFGDEPAGWVASGKPHSGDAIVAHKDLQTAICIAAYLTAQEMK